MSDATQLFILLGVTLAAFVWGRFRYDIVALGALLAAAVLGLVPMGEAFLGFGHPAVVTVAAVLILSKGFERSGLVDIIAGQTLKVGDNLMLQLLVLTGTVLVLSAMMNNVGALALMLPVAIRMAREHQASPSLLLMPLAFGSLLGGLITLIGTPPNIIIATYRANQGEGAFGMFDFTPVGLTVALTGLVFMVLIGWRLTPRRKSRVDSESLFDISHYLVELRVGEETRAKGWTLQQLQRELGDNLPVLAVVRDDDRLAGYAFLGTLQEGDILLMEAGPEEMKLLESKAGLKVGSHAQDDSQDEGQEENSEEKQDDTPSTKGLQLIEAVVRNDSIMINRTVVHLRLLNQHGLHLVAVARDGTRLRERLRNVRFRVGDVLLLQGDESHLAESLATLGCLPLAKRELSLGQPRRLLLSLGIFVLAIASMLLDWLPASVAMTAAALASLMVGVLPLREAYQAIDGPVIVLLGAMIPVGQALDTSGGARLIAETMLGLGSEWPPVVTLIVLFAMTLMLSNVINNAAAALLMAPIASSLATGFALNLDPFLMVVAVSASCAFLTPIGHQSSTLVMGPGGYRFHDYWMLGLPLSLLVMAVAIPMIMLVWPLR
ncbi:SLC13 family permease [Pistricoccus aurantiacus]|uniref:SLC13 family permease n=1 Tax=Pistricoccus aurantiacus TaxID=1883414 RepID=UPI00363F5511